MNVFVGDDSRKPRILSGEDSGEFLEENKDLIIRIPEEFRNSFESNILSALADIAGVASVSVSPFILNVDSLGRAFGGAQSILSLDVCDFVVTAPLIYRERIQRPEEPRFVHIDLGLTRDSVGIACGFVPGFYAMDRGGVKEMYPIIVFDYVLEVAPPRNMEINIGSIRELIYKSMEAGVNVKWLTMDSFQSADTLQILRGKGLVVGNFSLDKSPVGYYMLKQAIYDERVYLPAQAKAHKELVGLEIDVKRKKIDHPPHGSKDLADSIAGVVYGLTRRQDIWLRFGVDVVPESIKGAMRAHSGEFEAIRSKAERQAIIN